MGTCCTFFYYSKEVKINICISSRSCFAQLNGCLVGHQKSQRFLENLKKLQKSNEKSPLFISLVHRNVHSFALGKFHGKYGVAAAVEKQVRTFIFTHNEEAEEYDIVTLSDVPSQEFEIFLNSV